MKCQVEGCVANALYSGLCTVCFGRFLSGKTLKLKANRHEAEQFEFDFMDKVKNARFGTIS